MSDKTELKPCPFCGGAGYLDDSLRRTYQTIRCYQCGIEGPRGGSAVETIAAWNRRESPSFNQGRSTALRQAAQFICCPDPDLPTDRDAALGYLANEFIGRAETIERAAIDAARREQP